MKIICITGGLGTGKTTVSNILRFMGYPVIDFDNLTILSLEHNKNRLMLEFGEDIIIDGKVSKEKLKEIVFKDKNKMKILEKITHPYIFYVALKKVLYLIFKGHAIIFMEVPLFFELGLNKFFDNILVICNSEIQYKRLKLRDGSVLLKERIESQIPLIDKLSKSTYIIDNNGSIEETRKTVVQLQIYGTNIYIWISVIFIFSIIIMCN